jgi:hypothetical protein
MKKGLGIGNHFFGDHDPSEEKGWVNKWLIEENKIRKTGGVIPK